MVESQDNKPQDDNEPWVGTPWVLEHYNREQPWHYRELQQSPSNSMTGSGGSPRGL
jgi:hypothetical protein